MTVTWTTVVFDESPLVAWGIAHYLGSRFVYMDIVWCSRIADLRLVGGIAGHEAIDGLRERLRPALPAVVITADVCSALANAMLTAIIAVFRKPVDALKLRASLSNLTDS